MATSTCNLLDMPCHYNNGIEQLKAFFLYIWNQILDGCLYLLNLIPVPSWAQNSGGIFSNIPSGVAYFLSIFEVNFGLGILGSALLIRFTIRRLPFIG